MTFYHTAQRGFTLIELAIVLVIIGLIVGGVLVGQSLISAAAVRATISQVEKFNAAANTFRNKYGALPGDINGNTAIGFGLSIAARNQSTYFQGLEGMGDGNGVIEGVINPQSPSSSNGLFQAGETFLFWQDLASANLIPGLSTNQLLDDSSHVPCYGFPEAKIGGGNCFYVWSGGVLGGNGINYFSISAYVNLDGYGRCSYCLGSNPGLTVKQSYDIDSKIDDGLPQSGNVKSLYLSADNQGHYYVAWAGVGIQNQGGIAATSDSGYTTATQGSATTCFDNGYNAGIQQTYSVAQNNGTGLNCALSFKMQAGD